MAFNPLGLLHKIKELRKINQKPKTEEEIAKELEAKREQIIIKSAKFRHLVGSDKTGWKELVSAVEQYIEACHIRKLKTRLDIASAETIKELQFIDRDVFILNWVMQIPQQYIDLSEKKENAKEKE